MILSSVKILFLNFGGLIQRAISDTPTRWADMRIFPDTCGGVPGGDVGLGLN